MKSALLVWTLGGWLIVLNGDFDLRRTILVVGLCFVSLISLATQGRLQRHLRAKSVLFTLATATALGFTSAARSSLSNWSLLEVVFFALSLSTIYALSWLCITARFEISRYVLLWITLPVAIVCAMSVVNIYSSLISGLSLTYPEPISDFANIRFFNQYQTWLLPFVTAAIFIPPPHLSIRTAIWRLLVSTLAVFFWLLYWHSHGRGTGYATFLAALMTTVLCGRHGRRYFIITLGFAILGYLAESVMFLSPADGGAHLASLQSSGRLYLWHIALDVLAAHPVLGIGPMMFASIDTGEAAHPHNAILQWASEWGIPAAVLIMTAIGCCFWRWYRALPVLLAQSKKDAQIATATTASLIAGTIHGLLSGVIVMPASQFMLITVAALAAAQAASVKPSRIDTLESPKLKRFVTYAYSLWIVLASLLLATLTVTSYQSHVTQSLSSRSVYTRNLNQPRFWVDGTLTSLVEKP